MTLTFALIEDDTQPSRPTTSGPVAMSTGDKKAVGRPGTPATSGNSVIAPSVVIRPILLAPFSVNHSAPSGPEAIPSTWP